MLSLPGSAAGWAIQAQEIQQHSQHRGDAGPLLPPPPANSLYGAQPPYPPSDGPAAPQRDTSPEPYGPMRMISSTTTRSRSKEELTVLLKRVATTTTTPRWKMPKRNEPSSLCALHTTSGHESQTRASCVAKPLCLGFWVEKRGLRGTAMGGTCAPPYVAHTRF